MQILIHIYQPLRLRLCGHGNIRLRRNRIFAPPQARDRLLLCVELQTRLAVECVGSAASNRLLVAGEREHGQLHCISNGV